MESILNTLADWLNGQSGTCSFLILAVGYFSAWFSTLLPAPSEQSSRFYRAVYRVLNWLGANVGRARNADEKGGTA